MAWAAEGPSTDTARGEKSLAASHLYQAVSGGGARGYRTVVAFGEEEEGGEDIEGLNRYATHPTITVGNVEWHYFTEKQQPLVCHGLVVDAR